MKAFILILFIFVGAYMLGDWLKQKPLTAHIHYSDCDIASEVCRQSHPAAGYEVYFSAQPSALIPFDVIVKFDKAEAQAVSVSFEMENMDMGFNNYSLIQNDKQWQASVILPVCSLGRSDWKVKLVYRLEGIDHVTEFSFQQK